MTPRNELRGARFKRAGIIETVTQVELLQDAEAPAVDEFTANSMTRIGAGFPKSDGDTLPPQSDAESQTCEAAADDRDGLGRCTIYDMRFTIYELHGVMGAFQTD